MSQRVLKSKIWFVVILCIALAACTGAKTQVAAPSTQAAQPAAQSTVAPAGSPEPGATNGKKVATFIWTQEFDTLNPLYTNMWFSEVTQQLWDAWAWNFDDKNQAVPYLLTEMPTVENGGISADGKTITMKLRNDLKWSDNVPLTADDFIFTYKMAIDKGNSVASAYPYDQVKTMEAPDKYTVVITFDAPFAPWQANFWKGILPAHVLQPVFDKEHTINNAEWNLKPMVGCGPYSFAEWESGSYARFVRNDNYWGPKPKIDEIFFRFVPDDASQTAALKAGDGDLGSFIAINDTPKLKEAGIDVVTVFSGYNEGIFPLIDTGDTKDLKGNPAMRDVNVRKAIVYAMNRESITKDLLLGLTGVPASYWDALPEYNNPPLQNYPYDPEKAKKLLDEAGWVDSNNDGVREKDGVQLALRYGTTVREVRQDAQAVIQQDLAKVGIKVDLLSYDSDIFFATMDHNGPAANGELDLMSWSDTSHFPDPDYYYWDCSEIPTAEYPAGANWQRYCDKELDGLFKLERSQVDPTEREKTFQKINQYFYDNVIWIGLWQDPDRWAMGPRLTNYKLSGVTPFYTISDWDLK